MDESQPTFITPNHISLSRISRRSSLSARLEPAQLSCPARKKLAWVSLQGRLIGAEEATSARAIGGGWGFGPDEAAAWQMFSPLQRVLVVAIVAAATKNGRTIGKLKRSIEIRDEVLQNMQKKLEDLCEQMNSSKGQPMNHARRSSFEIDEFNDFAMPERKEADFCSRGHSLPQLNPKSGIPPLSGILTHWPEDSETKSDKSEIFKAEHLAMGEPEERRMSDLSVFSCVSSSTDLQLSTLAEEQGLYNLRKECEEKDTIIKELSAAAYESSIADSKRISELEEIIRRKNLIITRLKKDMVVLEQKIIQLTRQKRPSSASNAENKTLPSMSTNILYDMSSTSPSSSDSDTPIQPEERRPEVSVKIPSQPLTKALGYSNVSANKNMKNRSISPAKASHVAPRVDSVGAFKSKRLVSSGDTKRTRRHSQQESNCVASQKKWV